jgi:hypothetical protein
MYQVFSRTWWSRNADWPNGLEPDAGRKRNICKVHTMEEAREACADWMATHQFSKEDKLLGLAAEFDSI